MLRAHQERRRVLRSAAVPPRRSAWQQVPGWAKVLWALVLLLLAFGTQGPLREGGLSAVAPDGFSAAVDCQRFVRRQLGPLSGAAFLEQKVEAEGNAWSVAGEVLASDGAGARRRSGYHCTLSYAGHTPRLDALSLR
jgi:hypothetical protein